MMAQKILVEYLYERAVARVTLNSPKGNVLDSAMMGDLHAALDGFSTEPQLKLIQFIGSGDHFSFGASVAEHVRDQATGMLKQFHGLFLKLMELRVPTAALVSGQCLGGGLELALMCNFLFVTKSSALGQPEISLAVFPPPASLILPMKIGQARADDLLLTGRSIVGVEAAEIGLAIRAFDSKDAMLAEVDEWTRKHILPKSASSLRFAVAAARQDFNETLRRNLGLLEAAYVEKLMATYDANEGIASFLERRPAVWQNK
jgi:cyclohexa-1,5-dienecarbonyl-CoA hydratase